MTPGRMRLLWGLSIVWFWGARLWLISDDFHNPDLAGIAYNADLILAGKLPYVDSLEVKPPGTFFFAAGSFWLFGRELITLQLLHGLWLMSGAFAVAGYVGQRIEGEAGRMAAVVSAAVYLFHAPLFSWGYSSFMMPAVAWSLFAAGRSVLGPVLQLRWALGAGAWFCGAMLLKQQAAPFLFVLASLLWPRRHDRAGLARWTGAFGLGALAVLVVLSLPYFVAGGISALLEGLVPLGRAGAYLQEANAGGLAAVMGAAVQAGRELPAGVVLVVAAIAHGVITRAPWRRDLLVLTAASVMSVFMVGPRSYLHYLVQYVPLLAVAGGCVAAAAVTDTGWRRVRWIFVVLVALEALRVGTYRLHRYESMARRLTDGRTAGQAAGAHIAARTSPDERIFCWGWTAWPVYFWADRLSPSRVYKALGTVTTFNTNTHRSAGGDIVLRDAAAQDMLVADLLARPPAYFVYSPSFVAAFGAHHDPLEELAPVQALLANRYVLDAEYGDLQLYRRVRN